MKNIIDLPVLCLRTIFSKLFLRDLLLIDRVCPAWQCIQQSVCFKRKHVTIVIGHEDDDEDKVSSPFSLPYHDELISSSVNSSKISESKVYRNRLEFDWLDGGSVKLLTCLLTNVTTFSLLVRNVVPSISIGEKSWGVKTILMDQVIQLLGKWSAKIETLKLFINFDDSNDVKQVECDLQKLIHTINSFESLRHLTIQLDNSFFYGELANRTVDLSILGRLEAFYLQFQDDISVVNDSLVEYGAQSRSLRSIAIDGLTYENIESGTFLRYDDNLTAKFTQLPDLQFSEANFAMGTFCARFHRLERLSIRIDTGVEKIYKFVKLIRPLKRLVYLDAHLHANQQDDDNEDNEDVQQEPEIRDFEAIPQLPSVKIIQIYAILPSHDQLDSIQWDKMFPNLEILHYNDVYFDCTICEPKNEDEEDDNHDDENEQQNNEQQNNEQPNNGQQNEPEIVVDQENIDQEAEDDEDDDDDEEENERDKKHDKCLKLALQPWKQCTKLHSVYTGTYGYGGVKKWSLKKLLDRN